MSSKAQRVVYLGNQAALGTGVNVDVALRAMCSFKITPEKIIVEENIGSFAPARHYIGKVMGGGELSIPAGYYEHAPYIVSLAMGCGNPAFVDPDTNWSFPLPDGTPEEFALYSLEYSDGANHITRGVDVFGTGLEISGEAGKAWVYKVPLVGGAMTKPAAVTASPAPPNPVRTIKMADTSIYIDDDFDDIGTTVMPKLISFTWKLDNLQHQKLFAGSLSPQDKGNDVWKVTLEVVVECEQATIESEMDKILTEDLSSVRIHADDSVAGSTYESMINGVYYLSALSELDDRDGNNTVKLTYMGQKDECDNTGGVTINSVLAAL